MCLFAEKNNVNLDYTLQCVTTPLLSIERADWPKLHDVFKARGAEAW